MKEHVQERFVPYGKVKRKKLMSLILNVLYHKRELVYFHGLTYQPQNIMNLKNRVEIKQVAPSQVRFLFKLFTGYFVFLTL